MQQYADIYLLINYSTYFGRSVLLMMGAMDARNVYSNLAVNKYLHTVASCRITSAYHVAQFLSALSDVT